MTKRFFLLLVIVFSVTGVKAQQTNIEDWAAYLSTAVPKEYFNFFFKSGGSIVKRIYYFKYKDEKYLALYEKGKLLNVKLAGEDYFQLLEQNYKDLKYNANNLLKVCRKVFPNYKTDYLNTAIDIRNVAIKFKSVHCNHFRLPSEVTLVDEKFQPFYSLLNEIVQKMEADLE